MHIILLKTFSLCRKIIPPLALLLRQIKSLKFMKNSSGIKENLHIQSAELINNISKLLYDFIENIDVSPKIETIIDQMDNRGFTIPQLEKIINELIYDKYPKGVRDPTRAYGIIKYRHMMWFILHDAGYIYEDISLYFGVKHPTVINGYKKTKELLEVRDTWTIRIYYKILEQIKDFVNKKSSCQDSPIAI